MTILCVQAEQRQAWALKFFYKTVHQEARDELNALEVQSRAQYQYQY